MDPHLNPFIYLINLAQVILLVVHLQVELLVVENMCLELEDQVDQVVVVKVVVDLVELVLQVEQTRVVVEEL